MLRYLNALPNEYREALNMDLMTKAFDPPLEEFIFDAFKGFEILPNIKILGYEWVPDEEKYDINDHVIRRNSNKNKIIKSIAETRCGVMYVDVEVRGVDKAGRQQVHYIKKPIIIPIEDENGYYLIKGKKCYLIYQLVDKMLYPSFGAVTVKSLMPICVKTSKDDYQDTDGNVYTIPTYTIQIFKSAIAIFLMYSHLTITKTLQFLEVDRFIRVEKKGETYPQTPNVIRFECNKKTDVMIAVKREAFEREVYVKSMVGCLINLFNETHVQYDDRDDWELWMMIVGGKNTVRRGIYQHIFFNRLLDEVTRKELKLPEYDKQDIYHLLKWILQNYHTLWSKDNLSMINKRLRCHEYIATFVTAKVSKQINRIVTLGDRATIMDMLKAFRFPEDFFITKLYNSGVLRYAENNSDMDFAMKWKFTAKGPNSLGNKDSRRIPIRQRTLHPSMLGYVDVADSSSSDPGRSGSLSPYTGMTSLYFDESMYESELHYRLAHLLDDLDTEEDEVNRIRIVCDNSDQYNQILSNLYTFGHHNVEMYGVSSNPMEIIIEKDPRDKYRKFDEESFLMGEEATSAEGTASGKDKEGAKQ